MVRWLLLLLVVLATPAWADDAAAPVAFHKGQVGFSARFGIGARGILTYDSMNYCGKEDPQAKYGHASVCTGLAPLAIELEGSYGVAKSIELTLEVGIGIQRDFGTSAGVSGPRPFFLAPGARFFFSEAARSKLFVQPELVIDLASYSAGNDIGARGIEGYWIDLHRTYGLYFFVAETLEFSRWLSASFEAGVGFQGRYP